MHDVIACYLANTPSNLLPRLGFAFFKILWTLIVDMESITSNSTSLSAKSFRVQVDLPSGGFEQARRVTCASIVPSIFGGAPLLGFSFIAESNPSWQYFFLIRFTVGLVTFRTSTISLFY
jgi:hypothetical protein